MKTATIKTNKGTILCQLHDDKAPKTCANFEKLAGDGFYDGLTFHRVLADFMIQTGCPQGTGTGGPGYQFEDEFHPDLKHDKPGMLSMANSGPNTNGSQFFITHMPTYWLNEEVRPDSVHTVFGRVVKGMEIIDQVKLDDEIVSAKVLFKRLHEYKPKTVPNEKPDSE